MKKSLIFSCLLSFFCLVSCETDSLSVQTYGTVSGMVIDGETYSPIKGAIVTTTPASVSTLTDINGHFSIQKLKEGEVAVSIRKNEYISNSLTVAIYENENTYLDFLIFKDYKSVGNISIFDPVPGNGAVDQPFAIALKWKMEGNKANVLIAYNIYIFESNSTVQNLLGENVDLQEVTTSGLKASTTYFWYVVAKYEGAKVAFSPTWSFKTRE